MRDLISIIIPVYNLENYLERCLYSVINQTYSNIEIIIVNDGSTDNSGKIIDEFAKKDNRIKVLHKENSGVSDTRNRGLEIAKGDYFGFVDGDDEVKENMYQKLIENLKENKADISHCGFEYITPTKRINFHGTERTMKQTNHEALVSLMVGKDFEPSTCTKLFKKSVVANIQFPIDIKINEDLLFNINAFRNAKSIYYEDVSLYKYYDTVTPERKLVKESNLGDVIKVATTIKDVFKDSELKKVANNLYVGKIVNVFKHLLYNNSNSSQYIKVRSLLENSSNEGLSNRTLLVKCFLVYFPKIFVFLNKIYKLTLGKRNKW